MADPQTFDNINTASVLPFLRKLLTTPPAGPPAPEPEQDPQPDMSMFQSQPAPAMGTATNDPQQNMQGIQGLAQTPPSDQGAPKLQGETKGHKLLRILMGGAMGAGAGAGQMTFGGGMQQAQMLPLQVQHQQLQNQQVQQMLPFLRATQMANLGKTSAETQKMNAEVEGMPIKQAQERAATEASYYKDDPNLGLIDLRTRQPVNPSAFAPLTADEARVLGKNPGDRVPLKLKNTANEIAMRGITNVTTEQGVFERNRQSGNMTRLGDNPRMMFAPGKRIIQVADPNHPGETMFATAEDAVNNGYAGPQSASVVVPKNVMKWATTGEGGKQAGAFNTAIAHAELLEKAITALGNGDTRTLNSIKNAFKKEFGSADITNLQVISNAYSREITKMLSSGHMTDSEIGSSEATLPANASPEQMLGAIHAYKALAGSKMVILHDQWEKGMKNQPNFPQQNTPAQNKHADIGFVPDSK